MTDTVTAVQAEGAEALPQPQEAMSALVAAGSDARTWLAIVEKEYDAGSPERAKAALAVVAQKIEKLETALNVGVEVVNTLKSQRDEAIEVGNKAIETAREAVETLEDSTAEAFEEGMSHIHECPTCAAAYQQWLAEERDDFEKFIIDTLRQHGHIDDANTLVAQIAAVQKEKEQLRTMLHTAREFLGADIPMPGVIEAVMEDYQDDEDGEDDGEDDGEIGV